MCPLAEDLAEYERLMREALTLIVRGPPTIADSTRTGIDVVEWMNDDLVDIVVAGGGFIPFETPVHEFVEAARSTHCRVYGCLEATRQIDARPLPG